MECGVVTLSKLCAEQKFVLRNLTEGWWCINTESRPQQALYRRSRLYVGDAGLIENVRIAVMFMARARLRIQVSYDFSCSEKQDAS